MATIRELRQRIRSVKGIQKVTRAMEMVASAKLRKYQGRAMAARPYAKEVQELVSSLGAFAAAGNLEFSSPLFHKQTGDTAILVISSDRGLCGSYNSNVFNQVEDYLEGFSKKSYRFYIYGKKGYQYFHKRGFAVERFFVDPPLDKISLQSTSLILQQLLDDFANGKFAELHIFYTAFQSMVKFVPTRIKFLPIDPGELASGDEKGTVNFTIEPNAQVLFDNLVPKYLRIKLFTMLVESLTSEFAARRMAMKNASDAAADMGSELNRLYNRARQEGITKDLLDIVGGAEALR